MHKALFMTDHIFVLFCKNITLWQYKNDQLLLYHFEKIGSSVLIHGAKISEDLFYYITDSSLNFFSIEQKKNVASIQLPKYEAIVDDERIVTLTANKELQMWSVTGNKLHEKVLDQLDMSEHIRLKRWEQDEVVILASNKLFFYNVANFDLMRTCDAQNLKDFFFVRQHFIGFTTKEIILFDMKTFLKNAVDINALGKKFSITVPPNSIKIHYNLLQTDKKKLVAFVLPYMIGLLDIDAGVLDSVYKVSTLNAEHTQTHFHRVSYFGELKFWVQQTTVVRSEVIEGVQVLTSWLLLDMKDDKAKVILTKDEATLTGGIVRVHEHSLLPCQYIQWVIIKNMLKILSQNARSSVPTCQPWVHKK